MITPINLIKGDRIGSETDYRDQLPVNAYAVLKPTFGAAGYMIQEPGLTEYGQGVGIDRGGIWNERQENHYRISGTKMVAVSSGGVSTTLGDIAGVDTVSLPYSFNTQGVVANGRFYLYDGANLNEVTDPDLGDPLDCVWVDGYYFFTDGEFLYHTDIGDESAIDPLKFATAEFMPDPSLGVAKTQDNKVIVFGRYTTEYFVNVATDNFAFQRIPTRAAKIGIVGTHAKAEAEDAWYLLGGRKEEALSVHRLTVGGATKIATREVDKVIGEYAETQLTRAVVETYQEDGYTFLIIHLPNHVLKFNLTVAKKAGIDQAWSIISTGSQGKKPWRGKFGVFEPRLGKWVYGDKLGANLGILDNIAATQYEEIARGVLHTPFIYLESQSIDKLEIETMPGHTGEDDATVFASLTFDGVTHGSEYTELYGEPYDYGKRFIIRRFSGDIRDWVGIKIRWNSRSRMAFGRGFVEHG